MFRRFTRAVDVLAHEFTHAVTEHTAGLVYQGQSGALNESVADVFAACLKQQLRGRGRRRWRLVDRRGDLRARASTRAALRDMANPGTAYDDPALGKDPQPAHMDDFVAHHATTTAASTSTPASPTAPSCWPPAPIGGSAAEGAGRIWYAALTSGASAPTPTSPVFAAATIAAAGDHADAVREAWQQVGVGPGRRVRRRCRAAGSTPAGLVVVRRSGGIAGQVVEGAVDPSADDERAGEVRDLLDRVDLPQQEAAGSPQPDRYVYLVTLGDGASYEVQESALDDDSRRLVELVLGG